MNAVGLVERRVRIARAEQHELYRDLLALDAATPGSLALAPLLGTGQPGDILVGRAAAPAPAASRARRAGVFLGAALATAVVTAWLGW